MGSMENIDEKQDKVHRFAVSPDDPSIRKIGSCYAPGTSHFMYDNRIYLCPVSFDGVQYVVVNLIPLLMAYFFCFIIYWQINLVKKHMHTIHLLGKIKNPRRRKSSTIGTKFVFDDFQEEWCRCWKSPIICFHSFLIPGIRALDTYVAAGFIDPSKIVPHF